MVRSSIPDRIDNCYTYEKDIHPVDKSIFHDDTIYSAKSLRRLLLKEAARDPDDHMNDESRNEHTYEGNLSKHCKSAQITRKRKLVDDNDILNQKPYVPLSPFLINSSRKLALIDSGANISLLSLKICEALNITINDISNTDTVGTRFSAMCEI
jgi:hypothetical protein